MLARSIFAGIWFKVHPFGYIHVFINYIIDLHMQSIDNPKELELYLDSVSGIVEHGLFINMVDLVIVGNDEEVELIVNKKRLKE